MNMPLPDYTNLFAGHVIDTDVDHRTHGPFLFEADSREEQFWLHDYHVTPHPQAEKWAKTVTRQDRDLGAIWER